MGQYGRPPLALAGLLVIGLGRKFLDSGSQPFLKRSPRNLHTSLVWIMP